ncbi:glycerophosphodiester phosphodiesterase [Streptomyces flavofungini]|uniref:glycerophosphodiester phosphodiesterase n=1 Tax=Streptomyces flavofungini TaxID=68200 RepID=UPI0034DDFFEB
MRTVTAVAHRGDPYRVRENTIPSLRSALRRGADVVEIDVRLSGDGVPVLLHDPTLKRLWGCERPLGVLSAAEVDGLTEGGVPTLAAALAATEGHRLMIDLPGATAEAVRTVVGVVAECGASGRVSYCAGGETMLAVRDADPAAEIALTWTTLAPPRRVLLDAVKPRWLNYRFPLVDRELAFEVHRQGYLVSAWTPDTRRSMRRLIDAGVDAITTNRIDVLESLRTP